MQCLRIFNGDRRYRRQWLRCGFSTSRNLQGNRKSRRSNRSEAGKMETIIQKSVELGVYSIVPIITARTIVTEKHGIEKKLDRWNRVSAEAVKQCKRGIVPEVKKSLNFNEMLDDLAQYDLVLFPYEDENDASIKDVLRNLKDKKENIAVIIGPEGGFSQEEAQAVVDAGGKSVSLGKTILRTETAGPATLAMIMYELEI